MIIRAVKWVHIHRRCSVDLDGDGEYEMSLSGHQTANGGNAGYSERCVSVHTN
ncbi:MAG: hypothetical protein ACLS7B_06175 [Hominilimicola sp.]